MTKLLEQAFAQAAKLPEDQQDALAAVVLEELASDEKWDAAFAASRNKLVDLAGAALNEYVSGKTRPLGDDAEISHDR